MMKQILFSAAGLSAKIYLLEYQLVEMSQTVIYFIELLCPVLEHVFKVASLYALCHAIKHVRYGKG